MTTEQEQASPETIAWGKRLILLRHLIETGRVYEQHYLGDAPYLHGLSNAVHCGRRHRTDFERRHCYRCNGAVLRFEAQPAESRMAAGNDTPPVHIRRCRFCGQSAACSGTPCALYACEACHEPYL